VIYKSTSAKVQSVSIHIISYMFPVFHNLSTMT